MMYQAKGWEGLTLFRTRLPRRSCWALRQGLGLGLMSLGALLMWSIMPRWLWMGLLAAALMWLGWRLLQSW